LAVLTPDWLGDTPACLLDMDVDDERFRDDGRGRDDDWIDAIARSIAGAVKDFLRNNVRRRRHHHEEEEEGGGGDEYGRMGRRWVYGDGDGGEPGPDPAAAADGAGNDVGIDGPIPDDAGTAGQAFVRNARALEAPSPECDPASRFEPANPHNYRHPAAARTIDEIVIHITDGGSNINGTISWFQNPKSGVSAHYIVGQDGTVVQMVKHEDIAYHAHSANSHSIGIEHVARSPAARHDAGLYPTPAQYCASAMLVRCLCNRYGIPMDRQHILGHAEADPATKHTSCPNAVWDWDYYMGIVTSGTCPAPATGSSYGAAYGLDDPPSGTYETGSDFLARTTSMSAAAREAAIVDSILGGNTPAFMDIWRDVPVSGRTSSGASQTLGR
jgi:N-acetyl-anhydromuramyl-L-alanine amidase AmpD